MNGDAWVERTNLMLASGDLPDTFGAPLSDFNVVSNGEAGAFLPMNDLIDQFAPNVTAIFDKKPTLRPFITASDGNIYALFKLNEGSWTTTCPLTYLNKPWLGPGFITSIDNDMYLNMFIFEAAEMCGTVKYDTYADQWPEMYWPRPMLSSAQINEEQTMLPDIQALVQKTLARWITEGGADEEWDQFQEDLNSIGLPRLMEIWQENLDKFLAGTGGVTPRPHDRGTGHPVRPL